MAGNLPVIENNANPGTIPRLSKHGLSTQLSIGSLFPGESQRSDNRELTFLFDNESGEASISGVAQDL
jgi:hypothetical protein